VSIRRRTAGAAFALALAGSTASVIAAAVPAGAAPGDDTQQVCRSLQDQNPTDQNLMGACMSYFQSNPNASHGALAAWLCKTENLVPATYPNEGQCVNALKSQIPPPSGQ
jgi:hypothetical protein